MIRKLCLTVLMLSLAACATNPSSTASQGAGNSDCKGYMAAAQKGDARAQFNVGVCYENGENGPKDPASAAVWYRKAAEQGDAEAQTNLGYLYQNGNGVPQDMGQAYGWYVKAADQGESHAEADLGYFYANGIAVDQDYGKAVEYYRQAGQQRDGFAEVNLGEMYQSGLGVAKDYATAFMWYRRSAEDGNADGQRRLGLMYENGLGVPQDFDTAADWYRKGAGSDDLQECYLLRLSRLHLIDAKPDETEGWEKHLGGSRWCMHNIAWDMATNSDARRRDPTQALDLIQAVIAKEGKIWERVDTLAAAYAAGGDFADAVKAQQEAIALAQSGEKKAGADALAAMQARLALYQAGKPYTEDQK